MLISGSVNAEVFETWLAEHLCRELTAPSVLILDKARFHRPEVIEAIATAAGHQVLFLPPYSPDFNKIEHDFAALKRILAYAPEGTTLDEVVANYHNQRRVAPQKATRGTTQRWPESREPSFSQRACRL
jgi:putative transposase